MSTTQVFVELLIDGFGVLIWLTILICSACGISTEELMGYDYPAILIIPLSGIAYVLGILIDRVGYQIFDRYEKKNIPVVFTENEKYNENYPRNEKGEIHIKSIISYIEENSKNLRSQINYNRTRLRLCRSWILNFFCISASLTLAFVNGNPGKTYPTILFMALSAILCVLSFIVWKTLAKDYYKNIRSGYGVLTGKKLKGFSMGK